ncbi:MAG TPA: 50S ribosomal protein L6 [Patescibacteria group bacterium]|nr:50S ribosomal protein L6 [Patescibacteria group bacterium]
MSNIAKKLVQIQTGSTVTVQNGKIVVTGPKGSLEEKMPDGIELVVEDNSVRIKKTLATQEVEKYAGLVRALVANMMTGVNQGFEKKLELTGVGYRARVDGTDLVLNVGYSLPVKVSPVTGVTITVAENVITVAGANKQLVGDVASDIRKVRPPDPYKGKGIKYMGEKLRRKVGKAAKAVAGK